MQIRCSECRRFLMEIAIVGATGAIRVPCAKCGGSTTLLFEAGAFVRRSYEARRGDGETGRRGEKNAATKTGI